MKFVAIERSLWTNFDFRLCKLIFFLVWNISGPAEATIVAALSDKLNCLANLTGGTVVIVASVALVISPYL